jgi:hypothetical protein
MTHIYSIYTHLEETPFLAGVGKPVHLLLPLIIFWMQDELLHVDKRDCGVTRDE